MSVYTSSVVRCPDYSDASVNAALEEALAAIGGLDWVEPGMRIGVKVNMAAPKAPEYAVCTDPALVASLCRMLVARGAKPIVGDSPGGLYNAAYVERFYSVTGMERVLETGAKLNDDFTQYEVSYPEAVVAKHFTRTSWLRDCDAVITFAKLKTHGMMGMTGAVKNQYGTVPGTVKLEYHYLHPNHEEFAGMLVDLSEYTAPRLSLIDAVVAMDGNGPTSGRPRECGALIASLSAHEADLVGAAILGIEPDDVPTLHDASKRGLVELDMSKLAVYGDPFAFTIPNCELMQRRDITSVKNVTGVTRAFMKMVMARRPEPDRKACVGCGVCANLCPAKAIKIVNKLPVIDRKKCIHCFCCQEFCPKGAMVVHRTFIAKLLNK